MVLPNGHVVHRSDGAACPTDTVIIRNAKGDNKGILASDVASGKHTDILKKGKGKK